MWKGSTCLFLVSPKLIKSSFIEPLLEKERPDMTLFFYLDPELIKV